MRSFNFFSKLNIEILFLFSICALTVRAGNMGEEDLDIYLCIGQSNMAGRATITPELSDSIDNVFLFNGEGYFEKAINPLNRYSNIRKELSMQRLGPAYEFGITVSRLTKKNIGLVVNARGGSSINSWLKGSDDGYYEKTITRIREAMKYGTLKAVIWHQGEADSSFPDSYMNKLRNMVNDFRNDLGIKDLPFIVGQISPWSGWAKNPEGTKAFNQMIRSVADYIPYSSCVLSEGVNPYKDENDPHFDTSSQLLLGKRYAFEVLQLIK